jgi:hypothetical protein
MSPEQTKQYEELLATFGTPGWKFLMEQYKKEAEYIGNARYIQGEKSLYTAQGKLDVIDTFINLENTFRNLLEQVEQ